MLWGNVRLLAFLPLAAPFPAKCANCECLNFGVQSTSRTLASSIAFTGAGFSVYSTFIARGEDVVLPINTPVRVSLGTRDRQAGVGRN